MVIEPGAVLLVRHCKYSSTLIYLTLNNIVTLKSGLEVTPDHSKFKLAPFENSGAVSYLPSIVTMAVSLTVYEIFSVKE